MKTAPILSRVLVIAGVMAMLVGAIDPLEGALIILPGTGLAALGASLVKSRYLGLLCWSLFLVAVGVGELWMLSALGGIDTSGAAAIWWGIAILPYPVGWFLGLAGAGLQLVESFKPPVRPSEGVH